MWNTRCATSGKMFARLCIYRGLQSTATVRLYHFTNTNRVHTLLKCAGNKRVPIQVIGWCRQYSSRDQATSTNVNNDPELFHPTPTYDLPSNSSDVIQTVDNVASQSENVANATSAAIGGYTPSGILQSALDLLHTHTHMPWWVTIAAFTVVIRLMLVPMAVQLHINAIKIANVNPIAMEINKKMMEYKAAGNTIGMALEGKKLSELYAKHNCNPFKAFFMPLVQMPIFMSFFFALRQMTSLPLESMKTGGMLWFTDLTLADPTYVLPLMACASFITNIEVRCMCVHLCACVFTIYNIICSLVLKVVLLLTMTSPRR